MARHPPSKLELQEKSMGEHATETGQPQGTVGVEPTKKPLLLRERGKIAGDLEVRDPVLTGSLLPVHHPRLPGSQGQKGLLSQSASCGQLQTSVQLEYMGSRINTTPSTDIR